MVDRIKFIPPELQARGDLDQALAMPSGDFSISQVALVDSMIRYLDVHAGHRVLEVGGGTGYHAAKIAELGAQVFSVERLAHAVEMGTKNLVGAGISGVTVVHGDGFAGLPEHAPFDRISVACATSGFPFELFKQLRVGGLLLYPASIPGMAPGVRPDILLRIEKIAEITPASSPDMIKAALKVEQLEPVYFMRGTSPLLPDTQRQEAFGDSTYGGVMYDLDSQRPDISFLDLILAEGAGSEFQLRELEEIGFFVQEGAFEIVIEGRSSTLKKGQHGFIKSGISCRYSAVGVAENLLFVSLSPGGSEQDFLHPVKPV